MTVPFHSDGGSGPSSLRAAYFNLLKSFLGVGLLTFPYGFSIVGLGPALLLTLLVTLLVRVSMVLLIRTEDLLARGKSGAAAGGQQASASASAAAQRTFPGIVAAALGAVATSPSTSAASRFKSAAAVLLPVLRLLTYAVIVLGQLGTCVGYLTFTAANVQILLGGAETSVCVAAACAVLVPVVLVRSMRSLYPVSVLGLGALVVGVAAVGIVCAGGSGAGAEAGGEGTSPSPSSSSPFSPSSPSSSFLPLSPSGQPFWAFSPSGLWRFLGIALFAAEGIVSIPSVMASIGGGEGASGVVGGGVGAGKDDDGDGAEEEGASSSSSLLDVAVPGEVESELPESTMPTPASSLVSRAASPARTPRADREKEAPLPLPLPLPLLLDPVLAPTSRAGDFLFVLDGALLTMAAILLVGGWAGWACLGATPPSIVTSALPHGPLASAVARLALPLYILCTYPLQLFPAVEALEAALRRARGGGGGGGAGLSGTALRLLLLASTGLVAARLSSFAAVLSVLGWLAFGVLSFLVPPVAYVAAVTAAFTHEQLREGAHRADWEGQLAASAAGRGAYGALGGMWAWCVVGGKAGGDSAAAAGGGGRGPAQASPAREKGSLRSVVLAGCIPWTGQVLLRLRRAAGWGPGGGGRGAAGGWGWGGEQAFLLVYSLAGMVLTAYGLLGVAREAQQDHSGGDDVGAHGGGGHA
jgi:amino acid permease